MQPCWGPDADCRVGGTLSPEAITRYVKDCKRILARLSQGLTPKETAFVAKVSENQFSTHDCVIQYVYL